MDDELIQLEEELKLLRPAAPSSALYDSIGKTLGRPSHSRVFRLGFVVVPLAAAAMWTLTIGFGNVSPHPKAPAVVGAEPAFKPVAAQNLLLASQEEGYVTLSNGAIARRVRQSYLDTFTWKNPRTQASLRWTVPREEVRVVPVSYQ